MISVPQSHSKSSGIGQVVESAPVSLLGMGSSVLICNREKAIFTRKCYRKETLFFFIPKSMQANNKVVIFFIKTDEPCLLFRPRANDYGLARCGIAIL